MMQFQTPSHAMVHSQAFRWDIPKSFNFGGDVVDRYAREHDGPALIWANADGEERRYSYSDMAQLSARFASTLAARGIGVGDRVIVMTPRIPEWQVAIVGCLKVGAIPLPCIEMQTAKDIEYRVRHAGVKAVLARAAHTEKFRGVERELAVRIAIGRADGWESYDELMAAASDTFTPVALDAETPAMLYYTSGATGLPKGVTFANRMLYAWRVSAQYWLDLKRDDVIWCTADVGWAKAGTSILFGPWSQGACSFFYDGPFDPRVRLQLLEKYGITVYCAPSTELARVVNEDVRAFDLSRLRRTVTAGETLAQPVAARWRALTDLTVAEAYGQTETLMTLLNFPDLPIKDGSMGLSAPGCVLAIVDNKGERLPPGVEGEIALLMPNPQMMLGYWKDEARTQDCYVQGSQGRWFMTGDLGVCDDDGYFYHRGRRDDVISSAGYRIGPSEVEGPLLDHAAVQECAVIGAPDRERGEIVKAFVVLKNGVLPSEALVQELQEHVKRITAPYKYPRAITFVDALPKTITGKIQRQVLRQRERHAASAE